MAHPHDRGIHGPVEMAWRAHARNLQSSLQRERVSVPHARAQDALGEVLPRASCLVPLSHRPSPCPSLSVSAHAARVTALAHGLAGHMQARLEFLGC